MKWHAENSLLLLGTKPIIQHTASHFAELTQLIGHCNIYNETICWHYILNAQKLAHVICIIFKTATFPDFIHH